jgi:hypothetical protein
VKAQVALGFVAVLALAACGSVDRRSSESPTEGLDQGASASPQEGLASFLDCMQQIQYDYQPADTPAGLGAEADAVVTGAIVALRPGQSYAPAPDSSRLDDVRTRREGRPGTRGRLGRRCQWLGVHRSAHPRPRALPGDRP